MPTGDPSDNGSESLTDQPGQALEAEVTSSPTPASTGSTPSPAPGTTAPPAASGTPASAKPETESAPDDPVQDAIARLARPETGDRPRDEQGRFTAAQRAAAEIARKAGTPAAPAKPAAPAAGAPATAKPAAATPTTPAPGVETDPYHGFDERERAALKGKTRERIEDLDHRWKATQAELEQAQAAAKQPDEFTALITQHKLTNDVGFVDPNAMAGFVQTEAAITRSRIAMQQGRSPAPSDLQVASRFFERADALRGQLGFAQPVKAPPEIKPFVGDLPSEAKDLVEIYGVPEADVRLLLALKARQAGGAVAGSNPPPAAQQQPPTQYAQPPQQQQRPTGIDMEALYGQRFVADLARDGVAPDMVQAHYQVVLPLAARITQAQFPTVPADRIANVFDALPPDRRFSILQQAHREWAKSTKSPVRSAPTPPPPSTPPAFGGGAPRRSATAPIGGDAVDAAIAVLARPQE